MWMAKTGLSEVRGWKGSSVEVIVRRKKLPMLSRLIWTSPKATRTTASETSYEISKWKATTEMFSMIYSATATATTVAAQVITIWEILTQKIRTLQWCRNTN